ncbi:hypothetical protein NKG05_11685 [Oerskovia sp. M15]
MPPTSTPPSGQDHDQTLALAGIALGAALSEPEPLGGSDRSTVLRARVVAGLTTDRLDTTRASAHARGSTVVVKRFLAGREEPDFPFEREVAGLLTLTALPCCSRWTSSTGSSS